MVRIFPVPGAGEFDQYDDWATFTPREAERLGVVQNDNAEELQEVKFGRSGYRQRANTATDKERELEAGNELDKNVGQVETKTLH